MNVQKNLKEIFYYKDGNLFYLSQPRGRRTLLKEPAGTIGSDGYRVIRFDNKNWKAHKLIWAYHYNTVPNILDHIDRDKLNNHIENLREVTKAQNLRNSIGYGKHSKYKGVHFNSRPKKKWAGRICISNDPRRTDISKSFYLEEDAARWYNAIVKEWWGSYAYLNNIGGWDELSV